MPATAPDPPAVGTSGRSLELRIKDQAYALGFDLVGITRLGPVSTSAAFERWLAAGYGGTMRYLERGRVLRLDTRRPAPGAISAVVVAMNYGGREPSGPIARYARGADYHTVLTPRLRLLRDWLSEAIGRNVRGRPYVDTGPILERDLARRAGLGWFGKNTNLIHPRLGSFFFIGSLFVDLALEADPPFVADRCGSCTRCLTACPTGAFVAPHVLDATRCISYLTIENRGPIPEPLERALGELFFGCDICQDVCPWNERFASAARIPALWPRPHASLSADALPGLSEDAYADAFAGTALTRAGRSGLARNAEVVLRNRARCQPARGSSATGLETTVST
jgi:epoxyqueuosine reductase